MALPIELRDHPNWDYVRAQGRVLYHCAACNEDTLEPHNKSFHEPVLCDRCQHECQPRTAPTIKDQNGVYLDGKCIGYCKKASSGWVSLIEKQDDYVAQAIKEHCEKVYGGTFKLQNGPYVPPDLQAKYWKTAGLAEQPEATEEEAEEEL